MNPPSCPRCGRNMVLRKARKGKFSGQYFFGCSGYPSCTGIVNYDQAIHGPIEEATKQKVERSEVVSIDLPPFPERRRLPQPTPYECRPTQEGLQCRLFENATLPEEVPGIAYRAMLDRKMRRSLTQWRLDYPFPRSNPFHQDLSTVLAVTEKILLRGSSTISSPSVGSFIQEQIVGNDEIEDQAWLRAVKHVSLLGLDSYDHRNFDSQEEDLFYHAILPDLAGSSDIFFWTVPQVALSSLASGHIDQASNQRVDFLINHPTSPPLVIEIDGLQHRSSVEIDQRRDSALESHGLTVMRIPAEEIRKKTGSGLDQLGMYLRKMSNDGIDITSDRLQYGLALSRACGRVQVALLEAIKNPLTTTSTAAGRAVCGTRSP